MFFLPDITRQRAKLTPDATAFHVIETGEEITYHLLESRSARAASWLAEQGITAGDRVSVLCRNRVEFFELLFACGKLGAILVPLNWRMPGKELTVLIDDSKPKLLLTGTEDAEAAAEAGGLTGLEPLHIDSDYCAGRDRCDPHPGRATWPGDEPWYLIYTSGTTGRPKGVIQTYQMALVNYINIGQAIGLRPGDATLNFLPLFHTAGVNLHTLPVLMSGGLVHVLPGFEPGPMLKLIDQGTLDVFIGVPACYRGLALHGDFEKTDLTRLRHWSCGGAPLADVLVETFARHGATVCNGFGMTETGPTAFLVDAENALDKIGSVGRAQQMVEARIASPDNTPLAAGETGEIQFRGPGLTPGYWQRPDETEKLFTEDGWLRSGDLGRFDEDGYCFIAGRIKEMYISGGENVYPAEVENILDEHPAVQESAVAGVEDEKWGEVGCAHIILRANQSASEDELRAWCRERLAAYKVPKYFRFTHDLPRTAAGKVQKHLLPTPETTP
ncbi:MAG: long-chain fatty acid--CoA ligase [Maricaulis sp.]|uniref:class I adenylate-forming enzyme family protein n=1 Tax=Maricaulis sp. TaxID=1486257 RepID=UPI001B222C2F|nr:long-chain fatty acid--CoA ligase [Maricaulis sp.]MBO6730546.1 long-chain fatty acid--CoA ligase [Maricaulis sp.]MBO6846004.1 long-chain fatty acid--CoA ligase [Maricaulis sp.]MBO6876120.1 long-chain fatty acid--CoA ligase [Maricaulis sp.]